MSVIIYQDHIEILEEENAELLKEVKILRRKLAYYQKNTVDINDARKAMTLAAAKLPIKCKFVERNI